MPAMPLPFPASLAQKVARDIIEFGAVQRAFLGVNIQPVTEESAQPFEPCPPCRGSSLPA